MDDLSPIEFKKSLPAHKAILGIDYGVKRIGVAISDLLWMTATPLNDAQRSELARQCQEVVEEPTKRGFRVKLLL